MQILLGMYLFFGGGWLINRCTKFLDGHCHKCGYDLRATKGPTCPECNWPIPGREQPDMWEPPKAEVRNRAELGKPPV